MPGSVDSGKTSARVGVIGTSKRAAAYFRNIPAGLESAVRVVALADPDESKRMKFQELFCRGLLPNHYRTGEEMISREKLEALVIASPNKFHAHDAEIALSNGVTTLLEKPVAVTVSECRRLWRAQHASDRASVIVGFVLRYTPFYAKVKDIVASGQLGEILAIDADESLGAALTAAFHKGWRRDDSMSGGFIVEKCCHDLDILNWLVEAKVTRVFSMGKRTHFTPRPQHERHVRFDSVATPRFDTDYGDRKIREAFFTPSEGSPYDVPADSPDHQAVLLEYDQGTLCTLTMAMAQPRTNRRIKVFGTNGSLEGDIADSRIVIHRPHERGNGWETEELTVTIDTSGHHGGDSTIGEAFWKAAISRADDLSRAGLREGIEAVLTGIAAEQSRKSGQPVDMEPLRNEVFERHGGGPGVAAGLAGHPL